MIKKPELAISAGSIPEMQRYIQAGAEAIIMGEQKYGMRLPGDVTLEQLEEAIPWAHEHGAKIYVSVNNIMSNEVLQELASYLKKLDQIGVDAVIFGDPAVLMVCKNEGLGLKLHWNAEMTSTNYATANYWASKGAIRAILARELNMEQVLDFQKYAHCEVQVQIHGITNIYHSKRDLIKNYIEHQGKNAQQEDRSVQRGLFLIEQERQNERYPVYEDTNGTHIMSSDDICMIENLSELMDGGIDSFKIEGLLKSIEYNETVIKNYRAAIDAYMASPENYKFNPEWLENIQLLQDADRELTYGFFYKEQVY